MTTSVYIPGIGKTVCFPTPQEREKTLPPQKPSLLAPLAKFVPPVLSLPIDTSGNGKVICDMAGNDRVGDCDPASDIHSDQIWTYRQGQGQQSRYDENCMVSWWNGGMGPGGWYWGSDPAHQLPCGSGAVQAYPYAVIWDTVGVDIRNDTRMTRYFIDNFYSLKCWVDLPGAFLSGFGTGSIWDNNIGAGNFAHSFTLSDVDPVGRYRIWTWGTYGWASTAFLTGCFGACWGFFSPRQFDPLTGLDSKGRHIVDQAEVWVRCGGQPIPAKFLTLFPPPAPKGYFMFKDMTVQPSTNYQYRVAAKNSAGLGPWSAPISVTTPVAPPTPVALPVIIDNGKPGYTETGTGWFTWPTPTAGSPTGYSGTIRATRGAGTGQNTASWSVSNLPLNQQLDVRVTWAADPANRASNAQYKVFDGPNLLATVTISQRNQPSGMTVGGVQFQLLGHYTCNTGTLTVTLSDNCNGVVTADAVRFSYLNQAPAPSLGASPPDESPQDLAASSVTAAEVDIVWSDITEYRVQRSSDGGQTWTDIGKDVMIPYQQ